MWHSPTGKKWISVFVTIRSVFQKTVTYKVLNKNGNDHESCTSRLQMWNQPQKRRLDSEKSSKILFHREKYGEVAKRYHVAFMDPRPEALQVTIDKEIKSLEDNLKQCTTSCGLPDFLTKSVIAQAKLPPTPKSVQWKVRNEMMKIAFPQTFIQFSVLVRVLVLGNISVIP